MHNLKVKSAHLQDLSMLIGAEYSEYLSRRIVTPEYSTFYAMLPDIFNFIDWIHTRATGPLCFVSRDGYLLHKIYQKRYPESKSYYVYSSRAAMNTASKGYIKYIKKYVDMNGNFVDAHGTNMSHINFFRKHFASIPKKFVLIKSSPQNFTTNLEHYITISDMPKHWGMSCDTIEYFLRAPHASIVDVTEAGKPVYDKNHDVDTVIKRNHSVFISKLKKDYDKLVKLVEFSKYIFFINQHRLLMPRVIKNNEHEHIIRATKNPLNLDLIKHKDMKNCPFIVQYIA